MRSEQVKYFLETAQSGSMSKVAEKNFLTQPAVSTAISKLEDELGVQLLERSLKGVTLTEAGCIAQQIFGEQQQLHQQLVEKLSPYRLGKVDQQEGMIDLCATFEISTSLVNMAMNQFYITHPNCIFAIKEFDFLETISAVGVGRSEFGVFCVLDDVLAREDIQQQLAYHDLEMIRLSSDRLSVSLNAKLPLAKKTVLPLKLVLQQPIVIYNSSKDTCWHDLFLQKYHAEHKVIKTNSTSYLRELIYQRNHLVFVLNSQLMSVKIPVDSKCKIIPIKELFKVTIGVISKKDQPFSELAQAFILEMQNVLKTL